MSIYVWKNFEKSEYDWGIHRIARVINYQLVIQFVHKWVFFYLFICFFIGLFVCPFNSFLFLFIYLVIYWYIHLFISLLIYSFMYLPIHLFSGLAIKCYTGSKVINPPSPSASSYEAEECAPELNVCFTAQLTTKRSISGFVITLQTIHGTCINVDSIPCENYCNFLKNTSTLISSCTVSDIRTNRF